VHRSQDLHVTAWVETELPRYSGAGDLDGQRRGGLGVLAGEQEEVGHACQQWRSAGVDPVRVGGDPGVGGLPEHLGQPDPWHGVGGE